ncbi:MAG TPA: protoporphyrinogen oxidase [Actinomycetota bacterium]|nr:protoporphyrinogen oxidase [Actinomycetota bacterium]
MGPIAVRVVVVGGGVSGLTAAHRLLEADPTLDLAVLESEADVGGRLRTATVGGLELESGPDSFVARKPWAVDLCRGLGLELTEPGARDALIWTERGLVPLPESALGIPTDLEEVVRWPGLSRRGRVRALADLVRKARARRADESIGSLVRRRMGDEMAERLTGPLLGGLFAGDIDRLSVDATFPELARWERTFGSLIRGARAASRAAADAGPMFLRPRGGVGQLPRALLGRVGRHRLRLGSPVRSVERDGEGFVVRTARDALHGDAVVLATPAFVSAELVRGMDVEAAQGLTAIPYASTGVVHLVYPEGTADALPEATGFVVPHGRAPMTAATFVSRKWPEAAFGTRAVVRCFVGAVGSEDVLDEPDRDIVDAVCRHLAAFLPLPGRPTASSVVRWPRSMPQYEVGHLERVRAIEASLPAGIFPIGNAYHGVGVADAVRGAGLAAERIRVHLGAESAGVDLGDGRGNWRAPSRSENVG